jgi:hypothetical protein
MYKDDRETQKQLTLLALKQGFLLVSPGERVNLNDETRDEIVSSIKQGNSFVTLEENDGFNQQHAL